jgi:endonuclease/exonuclease/phosphatase family metal-dependent hydrolase
MTQADSPLRIMSYNVRYFGHGTRGVASTGAGVQRIARSIAALRHLPEVVCLQEVETRSWRASAANWPRFPGERQIDRLAHELGHALRHEGHSLGYQPLYFRAHRYGLGGVEAPHTPHGALYTTGLAMLVRSDLRVLDHNAEAPDDITHRQWLPRLKQTRIVAHASLEGPHGEFDVFNTHLSLPNFFARDFWTRPQRMGFGQNQLAEARGVLEAIERRARSGRFFLVGDFNALPGSPVDQLLRAEAGLRCAFRDAPGAHERDPHRHATAGFLHLRMHIDRLYASPGVSWLDLDDSHSFGSTGRFHGLSDHVPLVGRARLA